MPDKLSTARHTLYLALVPALAEGRVSEYPPAQVVAPAIYLDTSTGALVSEGNSRWLVATFPVIVVADGAPTVQAQSVDALIAMVWDLSRDAGSPVQWFGHPLDIGGASLRAATVTVDIPLIGRTLCDPALITP